VGSGRGGNGSAILHAACAGQRKLPARGDATRRNLAGDDGIGARTGLPGDQPGAGKKLFDGIADGQFAAHRIGAHRMGDLARGDDLHIGLMAQQTDRGFGGLCFDGEGPGLCGGLRTCWRGDSADNACRRKKCATKRGSQHKPLRLFFSIIWQVSF
jgi:hypothetical protein